MSDTSRVSGNASYGEATVRDTGVTSMRGAHFCAHIDQFMAGWAAVKGMLRYLYTFYRLVDPSTLSTAKAPHALSE